LLFTTAYTQNLVPNPSFEGSFDCCATENSTSSWTNYSESPDYFNSCNISWCPLFNSPSNSFGYQNPLTGNGYYGLITYLKGGNYREVIGTPLSTQLAIGTKYFVSMYASLAEDPNQIELIGDASNKLGMLFSTTAYSSTSPTPINNFAHFYTDSIITDTANWTLISGSFIADSNYSYLAIGNFFDSTNTDTLNMNNTALGSYYYIDNICISTDSLTCNQPVGLNNADIKNLFFNSYPNPVSEKLNFVVDKKGFYKVFLIDVFGRIIISKELKFENDFINVSQYPNGVYFIQLLDKNKILKTNKLIINH
jgi:hypothetical protein